MDTTMRPEMATTRIHLTGSPKSIAAQIRSLASAWEVSLRPVAAPTGFVAVEATLRRPWDRAPYRAA